MRPKGTKLLYSRLQRSREHRDLSTEVEPLGQHPQHPREEMLVSVVSLAQFR